jgi:hypothetical protein
MLLTKVVVRGLPFHFTIELGTKPVPFTVSLNPGPPGPTLTGTRGSSTKGTGLACAYASETITPIARRRKQHIKAGKKNDTRGFMAGWSLRR